MMNKPLPLAASVAALFAATAVFAQTAPAPSPATPASKIAKPSPYVSSSQSSSVTPVQGSYQSPSQGPYQGVSAPPADEKITTTSEEAPAQPAPVAAPTPAAAVAPAAVAPAVAAGPPSPELSADDADDDDQPARPALKSRSNLAENSAEDGIVTYVPGPANALPEGTVFRVHMLQEISAESALPGTPFRAKLLEDLTHNGRVVVPVGSELRGKIVRASSGRRIAGSSVIHLRPEEFILPDGTHYRLDAQVIDTQGSNTKATGEGNIVPMSGAQRTLTDLAVTSGGGAIFGASLGGPVGAAVGSAIDAGVVTGAWLFENRSADISEESTIIFSLTDPMFLTPVHD
jgi:hypothetical protein